jgi:hypothetical protein
LNLVIFIELAVAVSQTTEVLYLADWCANMIFTQDISLSCDWAVIPRPHGIDSTRNYVAEVDTTLLFEETKLKTKAAISA